MRIARLDGLGREHHGLEAGAAHLVDGECRDGAGDPGVDQRLARGGLPRPALQHVAEDHLVHRGPLHPGALEGGADDEGAELRRGEPREAAEVAADRRADGGDDDGRGLVGHGRENSHGAVTR
jgi:hypothetical protein